MMTPHLSRRDWLKASAVGIMGSMASMAPIFSPGNVFGHDEFHKPVLDFSLEDVRLVRGPGQPQQSLFYHPKTGMVTTQNERRAMVETRMNVGVWRAIRTTQKMLQASPADARDKIQRHLDRAQRDVIKATQRYNSLSRDVLNDPRRVYVIQRPYSFVWRFANNAMISILRAVRSNLAWAERNFEPELVSFLGIRIMNGVEGEFAEPVPPSESGRGNATALLGSIRATQTFQPLTDRMKALLDAIQRSHDAWVQGIRDNASPVQLHDLVHKHHREHGELESLARSHDDLTLLALQRHMHDIDPRHTRSQVVALANRSNEIHRDWIRGVRELDLKRAWLAGLNHSDVHVMLGVAGVEIPEITIDRR